MLAVVTLTQVSASFATQGLGALTGAMHDAFRLSTLSVGLMVTAVGLAPVFSLFVVGHLVDRHGERWVLASGALIMTAGLAATTLSPNYSIVLICLFVAGIGYSTVQPGGSKSISSWFPSRQRGVAMGVRQAGLPIGGTLAAAALPPVAHAFGWQAAFAVTAAVALAGGVVFTLTYRPSPDHNEPPLASSTPSQLLYGLARILRQAWMRPILWSGIPLVGAQFGITAYLMLFVRDHFHRPLSEGAILLTVLQIGGVIGRIVLAAWSDRPRLSRLAAVRISMACSALLLAPLPVLPTRTAFGVLIAITAVLGFFVIGWYGPWVAHVADAAPSNSVGRATGGAMAANQVAIIAAPPLLGLVHDTSGTYLTVWWILAAIIAACALKTGSGSADAKRRSPKKTRLPSASTSPKPTTSTTKQD